MAASYTATGINLKAIPMGESDRLLTVLTQEFGLIRAIAPGSRKHQSSLRGRSELFVVNRLLIVKGRSLDKIIQAESLESYTKLSQDLRKLTASQYLAELTLSQALTDHPQEELFCLLREHLRRLEALPASVSLACLVHAIFHLLVLAGLAPRVHACCITQDPLEPNFVDPAWRVGFSSAAGGTVDFSQRDQFLSGKSARSHVGSKRDRTNGTSLPIRHDRSSEGAIAYATDSTPRPVADQFVQLTATELALLQQLSKPDLIQPDGTLFYPSDIPFMQIPPDQAWLGIERILRRYAQYHLECPIRSAALVETCFSSSSPSP
jgi:DNA repair protein RecO (recombination protein O)